MIQNRIQRHSGLAGLAIANNQLALAAANRNHGVDGFDSRLHGFTHRLAFHHAGCDALNRAEFIGKDRPFAIRRAAQRVNHAAHHGLAHRHGHDPVGALDDVAFLDLRVIAQQHGAHLVFFQVQGQARHVVRQFQQLAGHDAIEAVNAGHAVTHGNHRSHFRHGDRAIEVLDLLANNLGYFVSFNLGHR